MEFETSIVGDKAPRDGAALRIAFGFQCLNAFAQSIKTRHASRYVYARKDSDLDLSDSGPVTVLGV